MKTALAFVCVVGTSMALANGALAQSREQVQAARAQWDQEPQVQEVVKASLEYFRVSPEDFDGFRSAARTSAFLPTLAAGYRLDNVNFDRNENQFAGGAVDESPMFRFMEDTTRNDHAISIGGIWDLRNLVFNPAEVQIYGLVGVQRDIMLEVTRTFFLRRQLMLRLATRPPEDPIAFAALELAIAEFAAILDVLTGGWFSEQVSQAHRRARRNRRR